MKIFDYHESTFVKTDDLQLLIKDNLKAWEFLEDLLPLIKKKSENKFRDHSFMDIRDKGEEEKGGQ